MADEDEARRQREITNFAALALGDDDKFGGGAGDTFKFSKPEKIETKKVATSPPRVSLAPSSSGPNVAAPNPTSSRPPVPRPDAPLFHRRVFLPRPLFFGPNLPPRVVKEARELYVKATEGREDCDLADLPPDVRNILGAFRVYGFGIDITKPLPEKEYWKGSPYVSTYQPVWNDRHEILHSISKPITVTRTATAPARLDRPATTQVDESSSATNDAFRAWISAAASEDRSIGGSVSSFISDDQADESVASQSGPLTDQERFSQWALGSDSALDTFKPNTFQQVPANISAGDSDDDSVIDDELKKQVGISDHLSKAIASLSIGGDTVTVEETRQELLSQIPFDGSRRPLTNFELTNNHTPLFAADDPSLPTESDLGMHETKEEQIRAMEQKKSQEVIEKSVPSNLFGTVACPNPAIGPDDFQSWNVRRSGRSMPRQISTGATLGSTNTMVSDQLSVPSLRKLDAATNRSVQESVTSQRPPALKMQRRGKVKNRARVGWWGTQAGTKGSVEKESSRSHCPPSCHSSSTLTVSTDLNPSPDELRKDNLPLSRLDAATTMERTLPFLSDRSPTHRFLQVDTQAVGFPPIGGEIEPLYCTLAIYNVDTTPRAEGDDIPSPEFSKSGRVTEFLHFDVVSDSGIAGSCASALFPHGSTESERLQTTRCGVFPIPSSLDFANLYAVLVVRKVFSDDHDFEVYWKQQKVAVDIGRLRAQAEKASVKYSHFRYPIAFGVAPLLQVFGTDTPSSPTSRAVQIPLFRYSSARGERQIIDHIMVMLYPRVNHKANSSHGPAPVTNGGTAMLVMRNFGYLGLGCVVDQKSSLARARLVDFTGEMQLRLREENEPLDDIEPSDGISVLDSVQKLTHLTHCISEPVKNGGRFLQSSAGDLPAGTDDISSLYAQELLPVPLQNFQFEQENIEGSPGRDKFSVTNEPYFLTVFCNDLILQPFSIQGLKKGVYAIKVELRFVKWNGHSLRHEARSFDESCIRNNHRGRFMVNYATTSCFHGGPESSLLDEFRIRLPLSFDIREEGGQSGELCVFFTLMRLKSEDKKGMKLAKKLFGTQDTRNPENGHEVDVYSSSVCAFTPLRKAGRLVADGAHMLSFNHYIVDKQSPDDTQGKSLFLQEFGAVNVDRTHDDPDDLHLPPSSAGRFSEGAGTTSSDTVTLDPEQSTPLGSIATLSFRTMGLTSLHPKNDPIRDIFELEPTLDLKKSLDSSFTADLGLGKDHILSRVNESVKHASLTIDDKNQKTVNAVISVTKYQESPLLQSTQQLFRLVTIMWRLAIRGEEDTPCLSWANPSSLEPLRIHSFVSIIHIVGATSLFLAKNGVSQLDGIGKMTVSTLGNVMALIFDESILFGRSSREVVDEDILILSNGSSLSPRGKRKTHIRQTLDLFNELPVPSETSTPNIPREPINTTEHVSSSQTTEKTNPSAPLRIQTSKSAGSRVKIDSKFDFQSALRAAMGDDLDGLEEGVHSGVDALPWGGGGSRRFMTVPNKATLSTIKEFEESDTIEDSIPHSHSDDPSSPNFLSIKLDNEIIPMSKLSSNKQMRVPKTRKVKDIVDAPTVNPPGTSHADEKNNQGTASEEDLKRLSSVFLDQIGKSLGETTLSHGEEGRGVGHPHHRKTRSASSIDWSLLPDDTRKGISEVAEDQRTSTFYEHDDTMALLNVELSNSVKLPSFVDRLFAIGKKDEEFPRWFPFTYEIVITHWEAILRRQRDLSSQNPGNQLTNPDVLTHASFRSIGVAVAAAPFLFEIIKNSLGYRIRQFFSGKSKTRRVTRPYPLVVLDDMLLSCLELIVGMVTDACLDSRNFDSFDLRQMSVDVNDSIVKFLRDLFSFLSPEQVQKLVHKYFSRFLTRQGKDWQDRDSSIGLRTPWELTKLRLSAVTAFVRYADFIKINSPQMLRWKPWMLRQSASSLNNLFDNILDRYIGLGASGLGAEEGSNGLVGDPSLKPHWLAEVMVDICLLGMGHAESQIQCRSSSLLFEMFWSCSQESILADTHTGVAAMFSTFLLKSLKYVQYWSSFDPKSQLRRDVMPCVVFVLQSAPSPLLCAIWRRLFRATTSPHPLLASNLGSGSLEDAQGVKTEASEDSNVYHMISLLNLCLRTFEYEGPEVTDKHDNDSIGTQYTQEFERDFLGAEVGAPNRYSSMVQKHSTDPESVRTTTSPSRRWYSHDGSLTIVDTGHQLVLELYNLLASSKGGWELLNPAVSRKSKVPVSPSDESCCLSKTDVQVFVRAVTSLYLQALTLDQSDIVYVRVLRLSAEILKIFGIETFLGSIGETLQHWMRVIILRCGARRAPVRIEATDLLELILRSAWESYGSFFRIRVPLLAVQTEVMERIVAVASMRYFMEKRVESDSDIVFSSISAEASLVPLWRSIDRIERQPASLNTAFRGALIRLASKMKKLYKAYIAARLLSFVQAISSEERTGDFTGVEMSSVARAERISALRILNASSGFSKQFLGFNATTRFQSKVAHSEAVEDALLDAADIFTATELPEHRIAWLRMLGEFHAVRSKAAEEAMCHFEVYCTLSQASRLHGSLWSNTPFLPWIETHPDLPVHPNGAIEASVALDPEYHEKYFEESRIQDTFRRVFYRVANSIATHTRNDVFGPESKNLFCGLLQEYEYSSVLPWSTSAEMEKQMIEAAENAGLLFRNAGIIESGRLALSLATKHYAEKFNYPGLSRTYNKLARMVVSQVPPVDVSMPQEVSASLGRFYRVWFHGSAPDELSGVEFVYRTDGKMKLDLFGELLHDVMKSIVPDKTPIDLVLDGRSEEKYQEEAEYSFSLVGPASLDPVKIKITPLRPLFEGANQTRGVPEWFFNYANKAINGLDPDNSKPSENSRFRRTESISSSTSELGEFGDPHHREHARSFSASVFSSVSSAGTHGRRIPSSDTLSVQRSVKQNESNSTKLAGVYRFSFIQSRDRSQHSREWWRFSKTLGSKSLKLTELHVSQPFPSCIARQAVVHRRVYSQSPLEAGIEAVCQWCSILFQTAVATIGIHTLDEIHEPGIGTDAAKVVADCIHYSKIKDMGISLLGHALDSSEEHQNDNYLLEYDKLSSNEISDHQVKLARLIVVLLELLHILIARNRELLLEIINERKRTETESILATPPRGSSSRIMSAPVTDGRRRPPIPPSNTHSFQSETGSLVQQGRSRVSLHSRSHTDGDQESYQSGQSVLLQSGFKTDSAIALQSELQRAFISKVKALYPRLQSILKSETPSWLKPCSQDGYFSSNTYKKAKIRISEEISFNFSGDEEEEYEGYRRPNVVDSPRDGGGGSIGGSSRGSERLALF